jgi:RNA polymerase sigma-70 factor, ECF subfamily
MRDDVPRTSSGPAALAAGGAAEPAAEDEGDAALVARLGSGAAIALDPLYRRHRKAVYRFALLWTGSAARAADVTQDVFMHLLTRAGDYDPARGSLLAWLLGITRNFSRQRCGFRDTDALRIDDAQADREDATFLVADDAAERIVAREDLDRLRRGIAALPPHYRDVLVLVELAERSYAEAAMICGCELNTVRSRLSRARALLARWLDGHGAAPPGGSAST